MVFNKEKIKEELLTVNDVIDITNEYKPNNILRKINYNSKNVSSIEPMQLSINSSERSGATLEMNYEKLVKNLSEAYGTELCNSLIILYMFHEFEHVKTLELFQKDKLDPYDYLVKTSMLQCDLLPGTYARKHDAFLNEYNAHTMSLKRFLDEFSHLLSNDTLVRLNTIVADNLYRGYILIPENYDFVRNKMIFKSPIKRVLNLNRSMLEFWPIKKAIKETSDLGLLYGGDLEYSDLEKVRAISCNKIKTLNIFDEIK